MFSKFLLNGLKDAVVDYPEWNVSIGWPPQQKEENYPLLAALDFQLVPATPYSGPYVSGKMMGRLVFCKYSMTENLFEDVEKTSHPVINYLSLKAPLELTVKNVRLDDTVPGVYAVIYDVEAPVQFCMEVEND